MRAQQRTGILGRSRACFVAAVLVCLLGVPMSAWGRYTPYSLEPGAFCYSGGIEWDVQFQAHLGGMGKQYLIFDFCHSGAFLNEMAAPGRFVATASRWHEVCWCTQAGSDFGIPFWDRVYYGNTVQQAFDHAYAQVCADQTPLCAGGGLGGETLGYDAVNGGIAFLLAKRDAKIGTDVNLVNAATALKHNGWPDDANIIQVYNNVTRAQLDRVYAATNDPANADKQIVIYIDDHGTNTDVLYSRHEGTRYDYEFTCSYYRDAPGGSDYGDYGISEIWIRKLVDTFPICYQQPDGTWVRVDHNAYYSNVSFSEPGWMWTDEGGYIKWFNPDWKDNPSTLEPGKAYSFGFNHAGPPAEVEWQSKYLQKTGDSYEYKTSDRGRPDAASQFGEGWTVWGEHDQPALDPLQAEGWDNGGDGWVLVPVPEPAAALLLAMGSLALVRRRR